MMDRRFPCASAVLATITILLCPLASGQEQAPPETFSETIDVVRHIVVLRVSDSTGHALTDLGPEDFRVTVAGKRVTVESASWIPSGEATVSPRTIQRADGTVEAWPAGRLIVFFVQTHFARAKQRLDGQMKFNSFVADQVIDVLQPDDLVAVVSHDSHMKLQLDFTVDHQAALNAVRDSINIRRVRFPEPLTMGPTLAGHLDEGELLDAANGEDALLLLARGLLEIPGERIVIMAGWGLGDWTGPAVRMSDSWSRAMALLQSANIPVISLHTGLEGGQLASGMASTSKATGGFFAGTQQFAGQAIRKVEGALAGYWEIVLRSDNLLAPGAHEVDVQVNRKGALVLFAPTMRIEKTTTRSVPAASSIYSKLEQLPVPPWERARSSFTEALRLLEVGELSRGRQLLDQTIRIEPRYAEAWYERGMLLLRQGELAPGVSDLEKYLELEPSGRFAARATSALNVARSKRD